MRGSIPRMAGGTGGFLTPRAATVRPAPREAHPPWGPRPGGGLGPPPQVPRPSRVHGPRARRMVTEKLLNTIQIARNTVPKMNSPRRAPSVRSGRVSPQYQLQVTARAAAAAIATAKITFKARTLTMYAIWSGSVGWKAPGRGRMIATWKAIIPTKIITPTRIANNFTNFADGNSDTIGPTGQLSCMPDCGGDCSEIPSGG